MFITALFTVTKDSTQSRCPSTELTYWATIIQYNIFRDKKKSAIETQKDMDDS